jgi:uncharacterized membrane protein YphA (DoxX/SURF4 family)
MILASWLKPNLFDIPIFIPYSRYMKSAILCLRLGLAFVLIYASINAFISPKDWSWFIPDWVIKIVPDTTALLDIHGAFELIVGLWLLSGKKIYIAAILVSLDMLMITLANISVLLTVFRDIGLFFAALALVFLSKPVGKVQKKKK